MAVISITIPNAVLDRVVTAVCDGVDVSNAKAKQVMIDYVKGKIIAYESGPATQSAISGIIADVRANIDIT
jgi:hypothetical protein